MKLRSDVAGFLVGTRGTERTGRKEMKPMPGEAELLPFSDLLFSGQSPCSSLSPAGQSSLNPNV